MEPQIIRTRFFNGQFLQDAEFQTEQTYHLHMRRRWAFAMFDRSGVVQALPTDLEVTSVGATTIQIAPGMAIGRVDAEREAREILLRDPVTIDLAVPSAINPGIGNGQTGRITLHYDEIETANPPSAGSIAGNTRFEEQAVLTVHDVDPPALAPNGEPYIRLADVSFDAGGVMSIETAAPARAEARLNAGLLGIAPPATLTDILVGPAGATAPVGGSVALTATGVFTSGPNQPLGGGLTWASSDTGVATVDGAGVVTGVVAGTATITATSGAVTSAGLLVTVTPLAPALTIAGLDPAAANQNTVISVFGNGLHDTALAIGDPAAGTSVTFSVPGEAGNSVPGTDIVMRAPDPGTFPSAAQAIEVRVPARASFPGPTTPVIFSSVDLTVSFNGGSATQTFTFSN